MDARVVLGLSLCLQLGAAILALWLTRITGKRLAWMLLAAGITLMAVRQCIVLWQMSTGRPLEPVDQVAELVVLLISAVMITGLALLIPLLRSIHRSEQALRESEERFRGLAESAFDGVVVHDGVRILEANPAFAAMFGYGEEEVIGLPIADFVLADTKRIALNYVQSGREEPYELDAVRKDGQIVHLEVCGKLTTREGRSIRVIAVRDITESKRAEMELRESEEKWRSLVENAPTLIMTLERDGTIRWMNRTPGGYSVDDVVGATAYNYVESPYHPAMKAALDRVFETGETVVFENQAPGPGGRISWYANHLAPIVHEGKVVAATLIAADITDRKRVEDALRHAHDDLEQRVEERTAELRAANERLRHEIAERKRVDDALRESEQRLRTVVGASKDAIVAIDEDGLVTLFNPAAEEMFGHSASSLIGRPLDLLMPEEFRRRHQEYVEGYFTRGEPHGAIGETVELPAVHHDGSEFPVELSLSVGHRGDKRFALAVIRDITSRKRTEEELRESSANLAKLAQEQRVLLEHTRDFVYRHDVQGMFDYLSPAVESITGYTVEQWRKHYTTYLTDNPINKKVIEYTEETLRTGKEGPAYLVEIAHKDGHSVTLEVNERPYSEGGKVVGIIGVARDVTERVRAQVELEKAKEVAEAASRAKSIFLANMSHEIRTPITAMLGAAELLASRLPPAGDIGQADVILRNGRHLLVLIDDLLDLSQAEAGKLEIQPRRCSLLDVIADVDAVTRPLHRQSAVDFRILFDTEVPDQIHTDPTRLKQALINLVSNALKFTDEGHVWVRVRVDRARPDPRLTIAVEDTGPGILRDDADRIFETFAQAEAGKARPANGVGLGLPLARWIAQQLGGSVELDTTAERGSKFILRVATGPVDDATWTAVPSISVAFQRITTPADTAYCGGLSGRILLAEDSEDTRKLILHVLTDQGATVTAVSNGREAVEAARESPFDLIILDVRMPEMDGPTAVAELRRHGCLSPIIALTALVGKVDQEEMRKAGFDDVWTKPVTLERLVADAAAYLQTRRTRGRDHALTDLERSGSAEIERRLAAARVGFAQGLPARLEAINEAVANRDYARAREALHQLVGSGGMHGFMPISTEAARLLKLAKAKTLAEQQLRALEALVEQALRSTPAAGESSIR